MKNLARIVIALAVVSAGATFAVADKVPKCPKCKMALATKKDKMHPMAVKVGKKTYYCCAACGAHKAMPAAPKKKG